MKWKAVLPLCASGFFSLSVQPMIGLLIPLWMLSLGSSPMEIGIAVSAGSLLPTIFSISSGAMIDQIGSRKVLLFSSLAMALLTLLYPVTFSIVLLILLQLLYGQIQAMNWMSSQTYMAKMSKQSSGAKSNVGVYSFCVNLGNFIGPMFVGLVWDFLGAHFAFLSVGVWSLCLWLASFFLQNETVQLERKMVWSDFLPRWEDYRKGFSLLAIPAVFFVMYGTFLRLSAVSMKGSFYLVYLKQLNFQATTIGFLASSMSLVSTVSPLCLQFFIKRCREELLLMFALIFAIVPLSLTPLFDQFWQFVVLAVFSGFGIGLTFPLLITILSRSVGSKQQGLAVGLRSTMNRLASTSVPLVFGFFTVIVGLENAFYVIGVLLISPVILMLAYLFKGEKTKDLSNPM